MSDNGNRWALYEIVKMVVLALEPTTSTTSEMKKVRNIVDRVSPTVRTELQIESPSVLTSATTKLKVGLANELLPMGRLREDNRDTGGNW